MKVAIYSRGIEVEQMEHYAWLLQELTLQKASILLYKSLASTDSYPFLQKYKYDVFETDTHLDETVDCVISLGGDGTVLDAAILIRGKGIPLLGINFGRLGFLATLGKEALKQAVEALVHRSYHIDQRTLIHVDADVPLFAAAPIALNEFVIHKRDFSPMIKIHTYLNGEFLNTYWADGLIVATPTGSTGYSLSCNGPVVFPDSASFVITPVSPHNLNIRPIVVPDNTIVSFEVEGRTDNFICSLDSRRELVPKEVQLAVRKESFGINLIRLNENNFLQTLRNKLSWGLDKRN